MKRVNHLRLFGLISGIVLLLNGCLLKPGPVPIRRFVLAPNPAPEHAPATPQPLSVQVEFVNMPSYLLRDSIVVRKSATEIQYLEHALWAERLDQSFRQTLANNLATLLRSNKTYTSSSERDRMIVKVSVEVQQFDVDTQGHGTLTAVWRLTLPVKEQPVKSGVTHLAQPGPAPHGNPQAIATTLSALIGQFSQELAAPISLALSSRGP